MSAVVASVAIGGVAAPLAAHAAASSSTSTGPTSTQIPITLRAPTTPGASLVVSAPTASTASSSSYYSSFVGIANYATANWAWWAVSTDGQLWAANNGPAAPVGTPISPLVNPIAGIAMTPDQQGLWLVGVDGGVFTVGSAGFYGSLGGTTQNAQTVAIVPTLSGHGYWLIQADGGVATFGDAPFWGSLPGYATVHDVVSATPFSNGYCMFEADGHYECWWAASGNWTGRLLLTSKQPLTDPLTAGAAEFGQYPCSGQVSCGGIVSDREGNVYPYLYGTSSGGLSSIQWGPILAASGYGGNGYRLLGADGSTYDFGSLPHEGNPTWNLSPSNSSSGQTPDQQIARVMLPEGTWGTPTEWNSLYNLWYHESTWNWWTCPAVPNYYPYCSSSIAYGIPQANPATSVLRLKFAEDIGRGNRGSLLRFSSTRTAWGRRSRP